MTEGGRPVFSTSGDIFATPSHADQSDRPKGCVRSVLLFDQRRDMRDSHGPSRDLAAPSNCIGRFLGRFPSCKTLPVFSVVSGQAFPR